MRQHQESPLRPSHQPNGQVLAAEGSGNVEPPDLPDGLFADDEEPEGAILSENGGKEHINSVPPQPQENDGNEPIKCKPSGDEDCQEPRVLRDPGAPSQKDIDEHEAGGHATYRRWCEACVEGRGVGEPHLRAKKQESTIPILAFDYLFVTSGDEIKTCGETTLLELDEHKMKILVAIDTTSGCIFSHVVEKKGVEEDRYSVDKLVGDIEWLGCNKIILKSDNEPAIVQVFMETLKIIESQYGGPGHGGASGTV